MENNEPKRTYAPIGTQLFEEVMSSWKKVLPSDDYHKKEALAKESDSIMYVEYKKSILGLIAVQEVLGYLQDLEIYNSETQRVSIDDFFPLGEGINLSKNTNKNYGIILRFVPNEPIIIKKEGTATILGNTYSKERDGGHNPRLDLTENL